MGTVDRKRSYIVLGLLLVTAVMAVALYGEGWMVGGVGTGYADDATATGTYTPGPTMTPAPTSAVVDPGTPWMLPVNPTAVTVVPEAVDGNVVTPLPSPTS
jgi:hypothetical protein